LAASTPESILGIAPLRKRLSKLLLGQTAAELLSLIDEIDDKPAAINWKELALIPFVGQLTATLL
jgi:hypothetical protein